MKPTRTEFQYILSICVALVATSAIADIPSAGDLCVSDLVETTPSGDFTALEGGAVVRHERTGLEWRRCVEGMSWNGTGCTGTPGLWTWQGALQHADGVSGWRLPNISELRSIIERCRVAPSLNQKVFPDVPGFPPDDPIFFLEIWSASPWSEEGVAWSVDFTDGLGGTGGMEFMIGVRLVRGAS